MRKALIVWGGWNGHEPEQCADDHRRHARRGWLRGPRREHDRGLRRSVDPGSQPDRADLHHVEDREGRGRRTSPPPSRAASASPAITAAWATPSANAVDYQFMVGGQWVAHPGNIIDYRVDVTRPDDPVMQGHRRASPIAPSNITCMSTPRTRCWRPRPSAASTPTGSTASPCRWCGSASTARAACSIPRSATWPEEFEVPEMRTILRRGMLWAAR